MTSIRCRGLILLPLTILAAWEDAAQLEIQMDLLQRHLEIETAEMRRMKASPMFWLHIPKCGTSFYNALVHLPGSCPGWPENLSINDERFGKCFEVGSRSMCPVWCDQALVHCNRFPNETHQFLNEEMYQAHKGKFVALFRQPEQRLLSAWYDHNDIFRADPFIAACAENRTPERLMSMEEFERVVSGWETKQLAGRNRSLNATQADISMALERLREGFAFVGLQEEWSLSICLFHAKFGGPCRKLEFLDTRPDNRITSVTSTYDTAILNGWVDEIDRPVYAEAVKMFKADLAKFGVSHESCTACYEEAGLDLTS
eukprot:s27_g33.t1